MPKTGESFSGGHTVAIVVQVSELRQTVPTDYVFNLCWCEGGVSSHTLAEEMERFCRDYPEGTHTVSQQPGPGPGSVTAEAAPSRPALLTWKVFVRTR